MEKLILFLKTLVRSCNYETGVRVLDFIFGLYWLMELMFCFVQNVLAAVFTGMFGSRDPDQVNTMAKQAGEVCIAQHQI